MHYNFFWGNSTISLFTDYMDGGRGGGGAECRASHKKGKEKNIADAPKPKAGVPRLGPLMHEEQLYEREQRAPPFGRVLLGRDGTKPCVANAQYLCWARQTLILSPGQRK